MGQGYNDNIKRPKPKESQIGILKVDAFCWKIHRNLTSWKGCVIQLNCREVLTHVSYKTPRTWENFNNQGTKMILLLDEL